MKQNSRKKNRKWRCNIKYSKRTVNTNGRNNNIVQKNGEWKGEYTRFRNLWDPLRELILRLKIMKKRHINICPFVYEI